MGVPSVNAASMDLDDLFPDKPDDPLTRLKKQDLDPLSVEELQARIQGSAAVRCDEPAFRVLGLSMAGWNAVYALGLTGLAWRLGKNVRRDS